MLKHNLAKEELAMMQTRRIFKSFMLAVACCLAIFVIAPPPVQADDWGISLDIPFFRVRAHDGYYYHDNDHHNHYYHHGHYYEPTKRYYYYPRKKHHHHHDHFDAWIGVDGHSYRDHKKHH